MKYAASEVDKMLKIDILQELGLNKRITTCYHSQNAFNLLQELYKCLLDQSTLMFIIIGSWCNWEQIEILIMIHIDKDLLDMLIKVVHGELHYYKR